MSTLNELNALRTANSMKPLKSWKESKAKLDAAIKKLSASSSTTTQLKASVEAVASKPVAKKPAAKAEAKKPAKDGTSISTIAAELGIDPKVARAKLRRAFGDADGTGSNGRWVFTQAKIAEIKKILQGDARKK